MCVYVGVWCGVCVHVAINVNPPNVLVQCQQTLLHKHKDEHKQTVKEVNTHTERARAKDRNIYIYIYIYIRTYIGTCTNEVIERGNLSGVQKHLNCICDHHLISCAPPWRAWPSVVNLSIEGGGDTGGW